MKRKKYYFGVFIIFVLFAIATPLVIKADSGWDYDYDYDYSYNYDYDNDYDYNYDYDSGGYYSTGGAFTGILAGLVLGLIILTSIFGIIFIICILGKLLITGKSNHQGQNTSLDNSYADISNDTLHDIDNTIDVDSFKDLVFKMYKELQIAWMDFDYDKIKDLTTDEMYNMYHSQLETLKLKQRKNIMSEIDYLDAKIINASNDNQVKKIEVYLKVECYDYVIDENKKVIRGFDNHKVIIEYKLILVKSSENDNLIEKCPNCGANVDIVSSSTCPYCDSTLVKLAGKYVFSKKTCIGQHKK